MADFIKDTLEKIPGVDPRIGQRSSTFSGMNEGPASHAARLAGLVQGKDQIGDSPYYTSNFGQVLPAPKYALNIGGLPTQADPILLEKQQAFDRSKLTERIVHPCGSSAFGSFTVTHDISHLTSAKFLQPGKTTPAYTRFSTVTYGREFPDCGRNPRGFATKFYTEDGNFDLVGLNWPVFFVRDPMQGPDNIRSQQRNPKSFLLDFNAWFDFLSQVPESNHAGLMLFSDYGTPKGWIHMSGYGCHTFAMVNAEGDRHFIKWHWRCHQKKERFNWEETEKIQGVDPDYSKRELFELIENGGEVKWTLELQVMKPEQVHQLGYDALDVTKVWPRDQFPLQPVGELVLNRNPEDYHRDVEQAAFSPGSLVPGIELSPDTLLQWRAFFYRDAQMHRLATANIHQIPVNCPFMAKYHAPDNYNGAVRTDANHGGRPQYFPNSYSTANNSSMTKRRAPGFDPSVTEGAWQAADNVVSRQSHYKHEGQDSEYDQVRELYRRVMTEPQRVNLHRNTAKLLQMADGLVQKNYLIQVYAIDAKYGKSIYDLLPTHDGYTLEEIIEGSKTAHLVNVDQSFISPNKGSSFMGMPFKKTTV